MMEAATFEQFKEIGKRYSYYQRIRWDYFQLAIHFVGKTESVLELGAYYFPLFPGSDTMDNVKRGKPFTPTILHDASEIPWPVEDEQYDLFIGLQVFEHLRGSQRQAFSEIRRIAKRAVLSFPFMWEKPDDPIHHRISRDTILHWTCETPPTVSALTYTRTQKPFAVLYYEF